MLAIIVDAIILNVGGGNRIGVGRKVAIFLQFIHSNIIIESISSYQSIYIIIMLMMMMMMKIIVNFMNLNLMIPNCCMCTITCIFLFMCVCVCVGIYCQGIQIYLDNNNMILTSSSSLWNWNCERKPNKHFRITYNCY